MNFRWDKKYLYAGVTAFAVIVASLGLLWLFTSWDTIREGIGAVTAVLSPIFYGLVIAYLLSPLSNFLERHGLKKLGTKAFPNNEHKAFALARALSVTVSVVLALALIAALLYMVLPQVFASLKMIVDGAGTYIVEIPKWLSRLFEGEGLGEDMQHIWEAVYNGALTWVKTSLLPQMETLLGGAFAGVVGVVRELFNGLMGLVIAIYLLYSREKFLSQTKKVLYCLLPTRGANRLMRNAALTHKMFGGFFTAKILDSLLIGSICYLFLLICGMPYAALIGVLVGVTNIIPVFGPFIGAIPSALLLLLENPLQCLWFLIFILALQQLDGNILCPKLMGTKTGLSSFWVMVALILGGGFFGFFGMLCGVPVFAVLYTLVRTLLERLLEHRRLPVGTEAYQNLASIDEETHAPVYNPPAAAEKKPRRKRGKQDTPPEETP